MQQWGTNSLALGPKKTFLIRVIYFQFLQCRLKTFHTEFEKPHERFPPPHRSVSIRKQHVRTTRLGFCYWQTSASICPLCDFNIDFLFCYSKQKNSFVLCFASSLKVLKAIHVRSYFESGWSQGRFTKEWSCEVVFLQVVDKTSGKMNQFHLQKKNRKLFASNSIFIFRSVNHNCLVSVCSLPSEGIVCHAINLRVWSHTAQRTSAWDSDPNEVSWIPKVVRTSGLTSRDTDCRANTEVLQIPHSISPFITYQPLVSW